MHTRLNDIIVPISVILAPTLSSPLLPMPFPSLVLELIRRSPTRLVHPLAQQRDLLFVRRPLLHALPCNRLYTLYKLDVVLRYKRDRLPGTACTSRTANSMDVVFGMCRHVVVDHDVDMGDIQTSEDIWLVLVDDEWGAVRSADLLATSVAMRTLRPPLLNLASAPRRALWLS